MHQNSYEGIDPDVVRLARARANRVIATKLFDSSEFHDLFQELVVAGLNALPGFRSAQALKTTYLFDAIWNRATDLLRARTSAKRARTSEAYSLDEEVADKDEGALPRHEAVADPSTSNLDRQTALMDVRLAIESLPPSLRTLCELHAQLGSEDARRAAGLAKSSHQRAIERIRAHFHRLGLVAVGDGGTRDADPFSARPKNSGTKRDGNPNHLK